MSMEAIRPSTLDGIKRLAKTLKAEQVIQHVRALDEAARLAGFKNFRHASNVLGGASTPPKVQSGRRRSGHRLFLTVYWKDRKGGESGRETLTCWLSVPWRDLVTPVQMKMNRELMHFSIEGPDHLARQSLMESQSQARRRICAAARVLDFMDATRLRPSKEHSRAYPGGSSVNAPPGRDHASVWFDPAEKRYLLADEPYEAAVEDKVGARAQWAQQHGFHIRQPTWPGMYNPDGGSRLYLIADRAKGVQLDPLVAVLNSLPLPVVEDAWDGESAPLSPIFISPGALTRIEPAKVKPKRAPQSTGSRNTVGYVQTFVGPQRRPKGKMPIDVHAEVGRLLKSVLLSTYERKGVYNRLNAIRSELDEWTQREYNYEELPNKQFFDLYYGESGASFARSILPEDKERHVADLVRVKEVLVTHYPDCPPLRTLLKKTDAAVKSLQDWGA